MRWVNIVTGMKQRINEILGVSNIEVDPADNAPNYWSIQSAMLTNLRRIVKAITGDSPSGRVTKGCWMSLTDPERVGITAGFAFTNNGDIIVFPGNSEGVLIPGNPSRTVYVYLKHANAEIPESTYPTIGKSTGIIGEADSKEIINDDSAVAGVDVVVVSDVTISDGDHVLLGVVSTDGNEISNIDNTLKRGLSPNNPTGEFVVDRVKANQTSGSSSFFDVVINGSIQGTLNVNGNVVVSGTTTLNDDVQANGDVDFLGQVLANGTPGVATFGPAAVASITVKNGIVTAIS